jgi:hypothetical protein
MSKKRVSGFEHNVMFADARNERAEFLKSLPKPRIPELIQHRPALGMVFTLGMRIEKREDGWFSPDLNDTFHSVSEFKRVAIQSGKAKV